MICEHSGIVQSVEQWTVNPYVTGSSPVARATISAVFCGFFIFSGNIANIPFIKEFLLKITCQREFFVSLITSQIISNVPATLLLYPFCSNVKQLLLGVNIGGLGTIIASLASLISFKLYSKGVENSKTLEFFKIFTLCNLLFLAVLLAVYLVLG